MLVHDILLHLHILNLLHIQILVIQHTVHRCVQTVHATGTHEYRVILYKILVD